MAMNQTPASERVHISFFGRRNAGKSSIINAVTGQSLAIVSGVKGTTTDPVYKTMELLPLGPVMLIDTPGIDDEGELGNLRIEKTLQVLNKTDIAVLITDSTEGLSDTEDALISRFRAKNIPFLLVYNKIDLNRNAPDNAAISDTPDSSVSPDIPSICVSAKEGTNIHELKERIASLAPKVGKEKPLVSDMLKPLDLVLLVIPIDKAAPKGRLILPQQQTIRDILSCGATALTVRDTEFPQMLSGLLEKGIAPRLVITDSQVFPFVAKHTPEHIMLTSFSILFARYKGNLQTLVQGASAVDSLETGDKILICEGCTHHRQCNDIGSVKLPGWIQEYTGKTLDFSFTSGTEFPQDLSPYKMVVHCGGCMLTEREMKYRIACANEQGIPMTNYGTLIAQIKGILKRSLEPFSKIP